MQTVAEYLGALQSERGASRNTLAAYRRDLEDFHRFLRTRRLTSTHVNAEHVVTWLEGLRARGLAPASVSRRLCCDCFGRSLTCSSPGESGAPGGKRRSGCPG